MIKIAVSPTESVWCVILWMMYSILLSLRILIYSCMNLHVGFQIVLKIDVSLTESVWWIILWMKHSILLTLRILLYYLHGPACEISYCV